MFSAAPASASAVGRPLTQTARLPSAAHLRAPSVHRPFREPRSGARVGGRTTRPGAQTVRLTVERRRASLVPQEAVLVDLRLASQRQFSKCSRPRGRRFATVARFPDRKH